MCSVHLLQPIVMTITGTDVPSLADTSGKNSKVKNFWHISVSDACMYSVCGYRNSKLMKCHVMSHFVCAQWYNLCIVAVTLSTPPPDSQL